MYCGGLVRERSGFRRRRMEKLCENDAGDGSFQEHKGNKNHFQVYEYPLEQSRGIGNEYDDIKADKIPLTSGEKRRSFTSKLSSSAASPFRSFRKSLSRKLKVKSSRQPKQESSFTAELQEAHGRFHRKQTRSSHCEEKKDECSFHLQEEAPQYYPPPPGFESHFIGQNTSLGEGVDESVGKRATDSMTQSQLEFERHNNLAVKDRLDDSESQLRTVKASQSSDNMDQFTKQIGKLQRENMYFRNLAREERRKREAVEEKLSSLRREHSKQGDRIKTLLFKEIPCFSPKFKAIGSVDHAIPESNSCIANYAIEEVLGQGQYGAVRRAVRQASTTTPSKNVAVKIIKKTDGHLLRYKELEALATEVNILTDHQHPNIIHLEQVIHATDNIYIVTELAATDLFNYARSGVSIFEECVQNVTVGLLLPLIHLHKNGICHLDLKPENVLLRSATTVGIRYTDVCLADFGLARMTSNSSPSKEVIVKHTCCGTVGFFAPEMILSNGPFVGQRADIWSLGCLLFEMIFQFNVEWIKAYELAEHDPQQCKIGLEECVERMAFEYGHHHGEAVDFLSKCLVVEPAERMTASQALQHPWLKDIVTREVLQSLD